MMERIHSDQARISGWGSRLRERQRDNALEAPRSADPETLLAQQRSDVLTLAREHGLAEGLREAESQIRNRVQMAEEAIETRHAADAKRMSEIIERLQRLLEALPAAIERTDSQIAAASAEIAYAALVRLLGERAVDRSLVGPLCSHILTEYQIRPVTLRVAESDLEVLCNLAEKDAIRILADEKMRSGHCRLESHKGIYETGLDVRLESLKVALLEGLAAGGNLS